MITPNLRPSTILCSVRKTGVKVRVDGQLVIDWKGDFARLATPDVANIPDPRAMSIGCYDSVYKISKMTLIPMTGTGRLLR